MSGAGTEIPKGIKLLLGMIGITSEMLANPAALLQQFGINPNDLINQVAEFKQIGLRIEAAFLNCDARLARIEAHLGIGSNNPRLANGVDEKDGDDLGDMDKRPPDRRN